MISRPELLLAEIASRESVNQPTSKPEVEMLWRKRPEGNEFPGAPVAAKIFRTSGNKLLFFSSFIPGSWERGRPRSQQVA